MSLKSQILLALNDRQMEFLELLAHLRAEAWISDQDFELAVAQMLQAGTIFLVPDTVRIQAGRVN